MKNTCIIIHGCPSSPQELIDVNNPGSYYKHWIPWAKKNLILKGIPTETPMMPTPWEPDYRKFKTEFEKLHVDENSILIGHSCGCSFLVRWLGETKTNIHKLILVAPWKVAPANDKFRENFYTYDIDKTIKDRVDEIIMFTSDNESTYGKDSLEIFHKAIGGKIINLPEHGHYLIEQMGTEKFPELLETL